MSKFFFLCASLALWSCQSQEKSIPENLTEATTKNSSMNIFPALRQFADSLTFEFEYVPAERREQLRKLADYIQVQKDSGLPVLLTFICTHNSRRSHMGQIWASAAAAYYNIDGIETFSGGTEATAFNPRAVAAMQRAGFVIDNPGGDNPLYRVHLREGDAGLQCFSKKYDDAANPQKDFAAIMTCSQADAECPYIPGAKFRLSLPYNDPKEADGTPQVSERYDERCRQIGREMLYAFSLL